MTNKNSCCYCGEPSNNNTACSSCKQKELSGDYLYSERAGRISSIVILDPITKKIYTGEQARKQPSTTRKRLINHYTKYGTWVRK